MSNNQPVLYVRILILITCEKHFNDASCYYEWRFGFIKLQSPSLNIEVLVPSPLYMIGRPCTCVFRESSLGSACTKPCIYDWAAMYICVRGSACTKPGIYDWAAMYICVRGIKFGEVPVPWLVYMYARPCTYVFGESSLALFL